MKFLTTIIISLTLSIITSLAQEIPIKVVASTTIIADVARNVGSDLIEVSALIPPDSDAHAFQPNPQDIVAIAEADLILINGAGLEEALLDTIQNAATGNIIIVSQGIEMLAFGENEHIIGVLGESTDCALDSDEHEHEHEDEDQHEDSHEHEGEYEDEHEHSNCDPHVWTMPRNVAIWADNIAQALASTDSTNADAYLENAAGYKTQLEALEAEINAMLEAIPDEARILVTNHDFLGYFAHEYNFEIVGVVIPGGSTQAEPTPQDIAQLIDMIRAEGVTAIFAEVADTTRLADIVAEEAGDITVATLYSGSLSSADGAAPTYIDYMRVNVRTIVDALSQ